MYSNIIIVSRKKHSYENVKIIFFVSTYLPTKKLTFPTNWESNRSNLTGSEGGLGDRMTTFRRAPSICGQ